MSDGIAMTSGKSPPKNCTLASSYPSKMALHVWSLEIFVTALSDSSLSDLVEREKGRESQGECQTLHDVLRL